MEQEDVVKLMLINQGQLDNWRWVVIGFFLKLT